MKFEVVVQLKKEVLDPEGRAIQETLGRLGFSDLKAVETSKRFVLTLDEAISPEQAEKMVSEVAHEYLANPVSQSFTINKLD